MECSALAASYDSLPAPATLLQAFTTSYIYYSHSLLCIPFPLGLPDDKSSQPNILRETSQSLCSAIEIISESLLQTTQTKLLSTVSIQQLAPSLQV